ncbi:MAG: hypothetical protein A2V67_09200 [Deltaproteobacteria bacterium RBG_13_61_14]|nr:MAG: hypothetical protein A2V67_09200 [Deltaproteobacteria bacterium RBG_13_61_14]
MTKENKRLIEDYLPIEAISKEASREKSVRKGHISTLHLWWARRPLVACRAAVYGALVPASRFVPPACRDEERGAGRENGLHSNGKSLGRANAAKFITELCKYPGDPQVIAEAQKHILEAHAERLTEEIKECKTGKNACPPWIEEFQFKGEKVTIKDIEAGRAPRPRVLDMFAGGGAIPLEALRLGCEAYALDLNPVAHIIELCTLVYPQKYGKPDPNERGMTGLPAPRRFWAYVIRCEDDSFYIGQTDNIVRRYQDHLNGKAEWTATHKPVELIHWEEFQNREEAVAREKELKTGFGRKWLKREWEAGRLASRQAGPANGKGLPACLEGQAQPGEKTWGGLAEEVRFWGICVLEKVKAEIGDLYPLIPDPEYDHQDAKGTKGRKKQKKLFEESAKSASSADQEGFLTPVAYLWTRTVRCKNPKCGATVPLVRQTWLCKKKDRYVAMKMVPDKKHKHVRFEVVEAKTEKGLGFDPAAGSKGGNATCPFCGTVADTEYVMLEGIQHGFREQLMAVAYRSQSPGEIKYLQPESDVFPRIDPGMIDARLKCLLAESGVTVPDVDIDPTRPSPNARGLTAVTRYGLSRFSDLFTRRQLLFLLSCVKTIRSAETVLEAQSIDQERVDALLAYLGVFLDRNALISTTMARWRGDKAGRVEGAFGRHALTMVWDFPEINPFGGLSNDAWNNFLPVLEVIHDSCVTEPGKVSRGTATATGFAGKALDAIITDPPYYDNIPYADISDFFYIWLRQAIGPRFSEHFAGALTPKKGEATALASRYGGNMQNAKLAYENMMAQSFREAFRSMKDEAPLMIVYAHKTTLGWATLVDALRNAGFVVTEAWPLDTEMDTRLIAMEAASLSSSIFLIARKREGSLTGSYEDDVRPDLEKIVRERVDTLWKMGITGADLVIAAVGAGLRAFTRFSRVEYANGEEVPAKKFLAEVEGVVLETLLEKIFGVAGRPATTRGSAAQAGSRMAAVDGPSRFYVLWRYTYKAAEMDAGEAIVFTYGQNVELDGQHGLSAGSRALIAKKKGKYRLLDFEERGDNDNLGLPDSQTGMSAPLIDTLHRILWLIENQPRKLNKFLDEARPDSERLRMVAQALAGTALSGKSAEDAARLIHTTAPEQSALQKLLANWKSLIEGRLAGPGPLFEERKK